MSKHPAFDVTRLTEGATIPSNVQLEKNIDNTKQVLEQEAAKRGNVPESKLATDAAKFLETTKQFIEQKNKGELIQNFIKDSQDAIQELQQQFDSQQFWIQRAKLMALTKQPMQTAQFNIESLKNLVLTLINSGEFRSLINEFIDLVQSMVKTEQSKTGSLPSLLPEQQGTQPLTEEAKLKAQQTKDVAQQVFEDIRQGKFEIPEDRKQLVRHRLRQIVNKLNADPTYQNSVHGLFQLFDQWQYWANQLKERAQQQVQQVDLQGSAVWRMWNDAKGIVSNFVTEDVFNTLITDLQNFYTMVWNDQRLTQFFWDLRTFFTEVIQNPALLDNDTYIKKWNDLYLYSYEWMNDPRYTGMLNTIWADFYVLSEAFKADTLSQKLAKDLGRVGRDVILDESGQPSLAVMATGLNNLRSLVAPILRKYLENVAVPGFSGSDETYDWQVEGMYLNAASIIPDNFELKVWGDAQVSLKDTSSKAATYITMWIRDIGLQAKDLKFHFVRKSIPRLDEKGICDVNIASRGSRIKIVWKILADSTQPGTAWLFSVHQVNCSLEDLDITVKESTHTYLMKFISTLFSGSIRRSIEDRVESAVIDGLGTINDQLNNAVQNIGY